MHKNVRREGEGQKLDKIYLKWINFRMDKILQTAASVDFVWFSSDMGLSAVELIWKILWYTYLANKPEC